MVWNFPWKKHLHYRKNDTRKGYTLSVELNYEDFTASNGWLKRFQVRHNIKCSVLSGESAEVSRDVVEDWQNRLIDSCKDYSKKNIYDCDETGLLFFTEHCLQDLWLKREIHVMVGKKNEGEAYSFTLF